MNVTNAMFVTLGYKLAILILLTGVLVVPSQPAAAASADGSVDVDAVCVSDCMTALHVCIQEAHQTCTNCSIVNGCAELAAQVRIACVGNPNAIVCIKARAAFAACMEPCRATLRADVRACRNDALVYLRTRCGFTDLPGRCGPTGRPTAAQN